ncbi:hypothetical protein [uncultured Campylobacter sp.]|uniref:hypothetical protein n=1 Tax=uncultured Campylobacter sp. TaxID=218934 RepID=UPI0028EBC173|nr:hypothetical protein [uncultured Campylobacter sp.]
MKIYFYKLLLGILLTGVFSFSLGFTLSHVGIISNAVFGVPLLPYAPFKVELVKAILTIISAFYIANKIINFRILGIDCKLNFIFFIAFSTIGVIIVSLLSLFMIVGIMILNKSEIAFAAMCLSLGPIWTAWLFHISGYKLGVFLQNCSLTTKSTARKYNIDKALLVVIIIVALLILIPIIAKLLQFSF